MRPTNERPRYVVMSSLIGWVHSQNEPCLYDNLQSIAPNKVKLKHKRPYFDKIVITG